MDPQIASLVWLVVGFIIVLVSLGFIGVVVWFVFIAKQIKNLDKPFTERRNTLLNRRMPFDNYKDKTR